MKNAFSIIVLFFVSILSLAQNEKVTINGTDFTIVTTLKNDTCQRELIEVYRNEKKLLTHILSDFEGDCSSENIELGSYEIKDSQIHFYSYWASGDRMGKNVFPFGFREQRYTVDEKGRMILTESELFVETYTRDYTEHEGMKFLITPPQTESEKELLDNYVSLAKEMYSADFVHGKRRKALESEIRKKLKPQIKENTEPWKSIYGENCNF